MKNLHLNSWGIHIFALLLFSVLSYIYCFPLIEGKRVDQSDITSHIGAARESNEYRKTANEEALWTNSMFGGMPTTVISMRHKGNHLEYIYDRLFLGTRPASYYILAFVGFYLLMLSIGISPRVSLIGALAFGLCSYNFQIIQAGHNGKMIAIAFMPWVLASIIYSFKKNPWIGATLSGITLTFEIIANHPQITYYLGIIVIFYLAAELYNAVKQKTLGKYFKTLSLLFIGFILALGANINHLWSTWEYGKYSIRGGSELQSKNTKGLETDYALAWSYGVEETPNLLIPNFNGGASNGALNRNSHTFRTLKNAGLSDSEAGNIVKNMPAYWGPQPFTSGPMYLGAVSIFLFILSLFLIKGPWKWWIVGVSVLAILLAWGKHFMPVSRFFYEYVPLYNKFRAPSMTLVILQLTIPLMGFYALDKIYKKKYAKNTSLKALKVAAGITAGLCILFALLPDIAGDFTNTADIRLPDWMRTTLPADRKSLLRADAWRSAGFIIASALLILSIIKDKIPQKYGLPILGLLIVLDMWTIDKRYLNDSHFQTQKEIMTAFQPRPADKEILKDISPNYRVLDLSVNTFNNSTTSYFHKTIGGYSAAKLQRYQDLIDYCIIPETEEIIKNIKKNISDYDRDSVFLKTGIINMLNTKYVITNPNMSPIRNPYAHGNAWFVKEIGFTSSPQEEIAGLMHINPKNTALVDRKYEKFLSGIAYDTISDIKLISYSPNKIEYKAHTSGTRLAVFSEIFYPKGWKAYVNGKETPIICANYILRSIVLPEGEHSVKFEFRPESYFKGAKISGISSFILIIVLIGNLALCLTKKTKITGGNFFRKSGYSRSNPNANKKTKL